MYYLVQLVVSRNHKPPYLSDGLYLVRAADLTAVDSLAKGLVAKHLLATDYVHTELPNDFAPPAVIALGDPDAIQLGVDISYTDDLQKVDWDAWRRP